MTTLKIVNLHVSVEGKEILKGLNLTVRTGEFHAIMGPNGTGKSTLSQTIMGHPAYEVTSGHIYMDDQDLAELSVDARARAGLFLAMQYPSEIQGVTNAEFMRAAINARRPEDDPINVMDFINKLDEKREFLSMSEEMAERYLNEGFSGGEKKRNEVLQMMMIEPKIAILDEIDSGLDIDALKVVSRGVNEMRSDDFGTLMITHYQRLLTAELAQKLESEGYAGLRNELGIDAHLTDEDANSYFVEG